MLLADGEALIIAGPQGLGKTTLAQQLLLGRAGFCEYATLLGFPIQPGQGTALYLAMDRPRRAAGRFGGWSGNLGAVSSMTRSGFGRGRHHRTLRGCRRCWRVSATRRARTLSWWTL